MKYAGMPFGMWVLFAGSFQKQLTTVLGYDAATAKAIMKKAKPQYRQIIRRLPEFEKADRFKMNIVNCAMIGAFILSMPQRPEVDRLTDYYAKSMMTKPMLKDYPPFQANDFEYLRGRILILLPENDIFKKEDQKRFADLFRKLDAEIRTVPGGHVGFIVQAERYLDLMETFLQRNGI